MKKHILPIISMFLSIVAFAPMIVSAQGLLDAKKNLDETATPAGVTQNADLASTIGSVINVALSLVGLIFLLLMVYAGYLWMTARGDEAQIDKSKEIIRSAIIGLVVVMSAYAITTFVTSRFK